MRQKLAEKIENVVEEHAVTYKVAERMVKRASFVKRMSR